MKKIKFHEISVLVGALLFIPVFTGTAAETLSTMHSGTIKMSLPKPKNITPTTGLHDLSKHPNVW